MRVLYFDCFSGASGDMILGALLDAGLPLADLRAALGTLALDPDAVWTERVVRAGITATKFMVRGEDDGHAQAEGGRQEAHGHDSHGHSHDHAADGHQAHHAGARSVSHPERRASAAAIASPHHHHHPHRTLAEIEQLIDGSSLSPGGKSRAKELFQRLGAAEAAIHGVPIERVHLHEVGALDSIVDIVGAVYGLERLGVERVVSSPLNVGHGTIRSAHGQYPVPAPATVRLLTGVPIFAGAQPAELVTPTGALLVSAYAEAYGPIPPMRVQAIGYGAGTRDFADTPNVIRVLIGEAGGHAAADTVVVLEAEIDDMNPQLFGVVMDRLLAAGALDVYYTSVQMKKNRPGTLLTAIGTPEGRDRLAGIIFRETTTIGLRFREMTRECLERHTEPVETPYGTVRVKIARRGSETLNVAPEFDDCVRLAEASRAAVKDVQAAALKAFLDRSPLPPLD